jgi:fructose 1,6-bisphosphate aldolase/phosphatase
MPAEAKGKEVSSKITISVIKADVGGYVGHSAMHQALIDKGNECLKKALDKKILIDFHVTACGDDLELIMTHQLGVDNSKIHQLAWQTFEAATEVAKELKLYGAGQDLLVDAFSGNVKGMGPGVAEMEIVERASEPIIIFMADKTSPGAWNFPLYRIFADPFTTAGLVIDPKIHDGFKFEILDVYENKSIMLACPEELYDLLVFLGASNHYMINRVYRKSDNEIAAVASTQKLSLIAGEYVGKDDPVMISRSQSGFPAVGEVLEGFAFPHTVAGWMRGSHQGPLMPVSFRDAHPTRFDGPPRVIAAGFQLNNGKLVGPRDMFDDPSFDEARRLANRIADYLRRHGPFEPHRLPLEEMEYTTLPKVMKKLEGRFKTLKT